MFTKILQKSLWISCNNCNPNSSSHKKYFCNLQHLKELIRNNPNVVYCKDPVAHDNKDCQCQAWCDILRLEIQNDNFNNYLSEVEKAINLFDWKNSEESNLDLNEVFEIFECNYNFEISEDISSALIINDFVNEISSENEQPQSLSLEEIRVNSKQLLERILIIEFFNIYIDHYVIKEELINYRRFIAITSKERLGEIKWVNFLEDLRKTFSYFVNKVEYNYLDDLKFKNPYLYYYYLLNAEKVVNGINKKLVKFKRDKNNEYEIVLDDLRLITLKGRKLTSKQNVEWFKRELFRQLKEVSKDLEWEYFITFFDEFHQCYLKCHILQKTNKKTGKIFDDHKDNHCYCKDKKGKKLNHECKFVLHLHTIAPYWIATHLVRIWKKLIGAYHVEIVNRSFPHLIKYLVKDFFSHYTEYDGSNFSPINYINHGYKYKEIIEIDKLNNEEFKFLLPKNYFFQIYLSEKDDLIKRRNSSIKYNLENADKIKEFSSLPVAKEILNINSLICKKRKLRRISKSKIERGRLKKQISKLCKKREKLQPKLKKIREKFNIFWNFKYKVINIFEELMDDVFSFAKLIVRKAPFIYYEEYKKKLPIYIHRYLEFKIKNYKFKDIDDPPNTS